jgi:hypothetical protein
VARDPTIAPYRDFTNEGRAGFRPRDFSKVNTEAIMVFFATDMQVIMDLLRNENGRLKTVAKDPVSQQIPIYFS